MEWTIYDTDHAPLRDDLIEGVSKIVRFEFPGDYVECVKHHHGGQPTDGRLTIHADGQPWEIGFGALLTLDPLESDENVIRALSILRKVHGLPDPYLPIAVGGGGDYLCLDYSVDGVGPKVVFCFHELEASEAIFPVADSFGELLAMLRPFDD